MSLHLSKCHIVGYLVHWLKIFVYLWPEVCALSAPDNEVMKDVLLKRR